MKKITVEDLKIYKANSFLFHDYNLGLLLSIELLNKNRTYINIGVNNSKSLTLLSPYFKNIIGFEPNTTYYQIIQEIKNYNNIKCYNNALSNTKKNKTFYSDTANGGYSTLHKDKIRDVNSIKRVVVHTTKLDFLVKKFNIKDVDYIKIDAEHEDSNILQGSINTIKKYKPIIQIESIGLSLEKKLKKINYKRFEGFDHLPKGEFGGRDKFFIHKD